MQADFVREYFQLCHENKLHTALDSSGVIFNEKAKELWKATDLALLDIKTTDDDLHRRLTGHSTDNNQATLAYLEELHKPVWIRHVITPGINNDTAHLLDVARYIQQFTCVERVELLPYHTLGKHKYKQLGLKYALESTPPLSENGLNEAHLIFRKELQIPVI